MPICCDSDDLATTTVYALTDTKKLQEEPLVATKRCGCLRACCEWLSTLSCDLSFLRCLGSFCWSVPLLFAAPCLVVSWYVFVPFFIDTDSMSSRYAFHGPSPAGYDGWGLAMLIIVPFLVVGAGFVPCAGPERAVRWVLYITSVLYVVLLIIGNSLGAGQIETRLALAPEFAVKFNEYYCESRTLRVCLEGSDDDVIKLMRGNNGTTLAGVALVSATEDQAALAIWSRCKKVMVAAMGRAHRDEGDSPGDKEIETTPIYNFLNDCNKSSDVDAWCGDFIQRTTPLTDQEHRTSPAPFALNTEMFQAYTREWSRRLYFTNILLGTAVGCMMLGAWSFKVKAASDW